MYISCTALHELLDPTVVSGELEFHRQIQQPDIFHYIKPHCSRGSSYACYRDLPTAGEEKTPVAKYIADRVLTLPMYADLSAEDADRICDIILK